jgi:hypothetical protein
MDSSLQVSVRTSRSVRRGRVRVWWGFLGSGCGCGAGRRGSPADRCVAWRGRRRRVPSRRPSGAARRRATVTSRGARELPSGRAAAAVKHQVVLVPSGVPGTSQPRCSAVLSDGLDGSLQHPHSDGSQCRSSKIEAQGKRASFTRRYVKTQRS